MAGKRSSSVSTFDECKCGSCGKLVQDNENGIECESCKRWFHTKCEGMKEDLYKVLSKGVEAVHWFCSQCNKGFAGMIAQLKAMKDRQDRMEIDIKDLRKVLSELKQGKIQERQEKLESELKEMKTEVKGWNKELIENIQKTNETSTKIETLVEAKRLEGVEQRVEVSVKELKEDVDEKLEIEKRRNNLIFHGVKEAGIVDLESMTKHPDMEQIEEILKDGLRLDSSRHLVEIQRIGRYVAGKIRPLRLIVKTQEGRAMILKRAKDLKEVDSFKKVFITPDLTRKQQQSDKVLREQVKKFRSEGHQNVSIRGGKVVKNLPGQKVEILYQLSN